ncbi:hypothetical protein [Streptomyces hokutonensis]|uniref:hypothetical protein n=1 Tax=Streptomyces hokutonensis TaxID=1306990 RepID=UPI000361E7C3|nr:hypothetical protein [Streptomyces hokutonensis]
MTFVDHRHERDIARELGGPAPYDPTWLGGQARALGGVDSVAVARLYGAARDGCDDCREDALEQLSRVPGEVAALALWACTRVMDTFNDLPMELKHGDPAFRQLARAYSDSTFRHGFDVRELTDLYEVCLRLDPQALQPAAEQALQLLLADAGDPVLFGSLTSACTPGDEDGDPDYTLTREIVGSEAVITVTPHAH